MSSTKLVKFTKTLIKIARISAKYGRLLFKMWKHWISCPASPVNTATDQNIKKGGESE